MHTHTSTGLLLKHTLLSILCFSFISHDMNYLGYYKNTLLTQVFTSTLGLDYVHNSFGCFVKRCSCSSSKAFNDVASVGVWREGRWNESRDKSDKRGMRDDEVAEESVLVL